MLMAPVMDVVKTKKKMLKTGVRKGKKKDDDVEEVNAGKGIGRKASAGRNAGKK